MLDATRTAESGIFHHHSWRQRHSTFLDRQDQQDFVSNPAHLHMVTHDLHEHSKENKNLWHIPFNLIKRLVLGVKDIFGGLYSSSKNIVGNLFLDLRFDWHATRRLPNFGSVLANADTHIKTIKEFEADHLQAILTSVIDAKHNKGFINADDLKRKDQSEYLKNFMLAHQDYHLTSGEANDILNSLVRGLSEFSDVFTHELFSKNPVAGLAFLATYGVVAAAVLAPSYVAFLGPKFLAFQSKLAAALAGSKFSGAISAASLQAQIMSMAVDGFQHGPSGQVGTLAHEFVKNPLKLATMIGIAYGTGVLLADGVAGHHIPGPIGDVLHEEANGNTINYVILGAKFFLISHALFSKDGNYKFSHNDLEINDNDLLQNDELLKQYQTEIQRFVFIKWLSDNHHKITKLPVAVRSDISRHIDAIFSADDAISLQKLVRHEKTRSIAFQLFNIPLSYIGSLLRICIFDVGMSIVAAIKGREHPLQPLKNGVLALGRQLSKDLSRLVTFAAELTRVVVGGVTSIVKMLAFVAAMAVGRLGAMVGLQPGHGAHRFFANAHVGLRRLGEILYPTGLVKHNVSANPNSTVKKHESSYQKLLDKMGIDHTSPVLSPAEAPLFDHSANEPVYWNSNNDSKPAVIESFDGKCGLTFQ